MAEETEISTPTTENDVTTSTGEVTTGADTPSPTLPHKGQGGVTTSQVEVTDNDGVAENGNGEQNSKGEETPPPNPLPQGAGERLLAGKYKSVEELEKGYNEAQKTLTQNLQIKAKYDELVKKQEQQEALRLERAKQQGYSTVNEQQIAQQVAQAELTEFVNALNYVEPDAQLQVQQYLNTYYQTGDVRYLNEAKRYYPSDFLENVAVGKLNMQNRLKAQYEKETSEKALKAEQELAEVLKTDYADFIETVKGNKGASKALEMFCNAGFVQSKEDMAAFKTIYDDIVSIAKEQAIKEYEAQKAIEKTKQAATIQSDGGYQFGEVMPTSEQISKMSQADYNKAVEKWGLEKILQAK